MSQPRIAVDAMGGDGGIAVTVPAARQLAEQAQLVLVGDIQQIRAIDPLIEQCCQLVQADTQVFPQDSIRQILRHRQDSSMHVALSLLSQDQVQGVVSGGDTRALMSLSRHLLGTVPGVDRPAIAKGKSMKNRPIPELCIKAPRNIKINTNWAMTLVITPKIPSWEYRM